MSVYWFWDSLHYISLNIKAFGKDNAPSWFINFEKKKVNLSNFGWNHYFISSSHTVAVAQGQITNNTITIDFRSYLIIQGKRFEPNSTSTRSYLITNLEKEEKKICCYLIYTFRKDFISKTAWRFSWDNKYFRTVGIAK